MERWDSSFTNMFACEATILSLFLLDIALSYYHNFFECVFQKTKLINSEALIVDEKKVQFESKGHQRSNKKMNSNVESSNKNSHTDENKPGRDKEELLEKRKWCTTVKIIFNTFFENHLYFKTLLLMIFVLDFALYFSTYPKHTYRFGRFFRTIPFPLYSKSTMRTLQAVFHSVKRIFDYLVFFFSIVLLYALLGYKFFYDENRTYYTDPTYDPYINDFNDYGVIVNSLVVLVTFDNYPKVMQPFTNMSMWYLIYFLPYIMLNLLFFKPVPIAVVYDGFRVEISHAGKKEQAYD